MWPTCLGGNCAYWGPQKAYDGREKTIQSLAIVHYATNPYVQFRLNGTRSDITAVRIVARADCCLDQARNLNVYLSTTPSFLSGTLCDDGIQFPTIGSAATVLCPINTAALYVTVMLNGTNYLSLQEVTPLYDGEASASACLCACAA
jgi:hypothetical protein